MKELRIRNRANADKKVEGKSVLLAKSHIGRYAGIENSLYSNIKDFTLTKTAYTLTKGATATINAKVVLEDEDKTQLPGKYGKTFRYLSTNPDVVTVDGNGTLTAVGSGTCAVYVYAINGMMRQVTVTVK
ncbi:MAG: Ig-like domain-containing protein [Lachnospiraceae bacterium]|nr:Ig-like domain-containing protein [Lachnospiraceae bacterium]